MYVALIGIRQSTCALVGELKNFDNIKMHGMYVKITEKQYLFPWCTVS
jgi:hypothetical protein